MPNSLHITLQLAIAWALLNATAISFFAALFALEESIAAFQRRRLRKSASVIPFSSR